MPLSIEAALNPKGGQPVKDAETDIAPSRVRTPKLVRRIVLRRHLVRVKARDVSAIALRPIHYGG